MKTIDEFKPTPIQRSVLRMMAAGKWLFLRITYAGVTGSMFENEKLQSVKVWVSSYRHIPVSTATLKGLKRRRLVEVVRWVGMTQVYRLTELGKEAAKRK